MLKSHPTAKVHYCRSEAQAQCSDAPAAQGSHPERPQQKGHPKLKLATLSCRLELYVGFELWAALPGCDRPGTISALDHQCRSSRAPVRLDAYLAEGRSNASLQSPLPAHT